MTSNEAVILLEPIFTYCHIRGKGITVCVEEGT